MFYASTNLILLCIVCWFKFLVNCIISRNIFSYGQNKKGEYTPGYHLLLFSCVDTLYIDIYYIITELDHHFNEASSEHLLLTLIR